MLPHEHFDFNQILDAFLYEPFVSETLNLTGPFHNNFTEGLKEVSLYDQEIYSGMEFLYGPDHFISSRQWLLGYEGYLIELN
jgi:hypothetical protein